MHATTLLSLALASLAAAVRTDPLVLGQTTGPPLEIVHLYKNQWPTGIAVSSTGRKFSCYPGGLDMNNVYDGVIPKYQVQEILANGTEVPYPNATYNLPPGGAVDLTHVPPITKGDSNYLLGVQSVVIDETDTLWILDTGRVVDEAYLVHPQLHSQPGGAKLVSVDLSTNEVTRTIVFPPDVNYPDSYINDVRFDRSSSLSGIKGGEGAAYITDSSVEGRNGLIVVDIGTGKSWRHLDADPRVHAIPGVVPWVNGQPMYEITGVGKPHYISFGADGIALSPDGSILYFSVIAGRFIYSVPTHLLRKRGGEAELSAAILCLGEKGISDGMETDSNGIVYAGNMEQDGISMVKPASTANNFTTLFIRDGRLNWVDTMSIATDGYLYFTSNQLNYINAVYPGTGVPLIDRRKRPFVLWRVPLPDGGTKINPSGSGS